MSQADYLIALGLAIAASLLVASIEIPNTSKASLRACLVGHSLLYWIILSFGNAITTLLASLVVVNKIPHDLSPYYFLFSSFFGVFAFESILKQTNVTVFGQGVLTIQSWIEKARNNAAAAAIEKQEAMRQSALADLVAKLMTFSDAEINVRILHKTSDRQLVSKLEAAARESAADPKEYKAFQLAAMLSSSEIAALKKPP